MKDSKREFLIATGELVTSIRRFYDVIEEALNQDWITYEIMFGEEVFDFHPVTTEDEAVLMADKRKRIIKLLLSDALLREVEFLDSEESSGAFHAINALFSHAKKEDYQIEIIKSEVISNLDENGNPITAKPLNDESIYIQWQDQNKFKFEEDENGKKVTS